MNSASDSSNPYTRKLCKLLSYKRESAERQIPLNVSFRSVLVGDFAADMIVEGKVLLELKAVESFSTRHFAQLLNYLKMTGLEVGMAVNFGNPKLEYRRFDNRFSNKLDMNDAIGGLLES